MSNLFYFRLENLNRLEIYTLNLLLIVKHIMYVNDLFNVSIKMLFSRHFTTRYQLKTKIIKE